MGQPPGLDKADTGCHKPLHLSRQGTKGHIGLHLLKGLEQGHTTADTPDTLGCQALLSTNCQALLYYQAVWLRWEVLSKSSAPCWCLRNVCRGRKVGTGLESRQGELALGINYQSLCQAGEEVWGWGEAQIGWEDVYHRLGIWPCHCHVQKMRSIRQHD